MNQYRSFLILFCLFLAICLPRIFRLDQFATPDEPRWLARSANFYQAVTHGEWENTFQVEHPGVTTMWAGMFGFLLRYPSYAEDVQGQLRWHQPDVEKWILKNSEQTPISMLAAGRFFVVLAITSVLLAAFVVTSRLLGLLPALCGFALIAFDPFHIAFSRFLHVDGLLSSFMLLSLLAFLAYLYGGRHRSHLLLSGLAAGLAWLTKSPGLFLVPLMGLLLLLRRDKVVTTSVVSGRAERLKSSLQAHLHPLLLWSTIGIGVFLLLWPAMWVDPLETMRRILMQAQEYATAGHNQVTYFRQAVVEGDPGLLFYPITYLWRTTPIVLIGLAVASMAFVMQRQPFDDERTRQITLALLLFAFLFTFFMTFGSKKFDRYLLPIFAPLDLVAGLGWLAVAYWIRGLNRSLVIGAVALGQLLLMLPSFPYYVTYYNPLLGGSRKAPEVMMIGWGEGLDEAARYLNAKPNANELIVRSWYHEGPFSYFFNGQIMPLTSPTPDELYQWLSTDYVILYEHQFQRQLPNSELLAYFSQQTPEHIVRLNGLDYAHIYNLRDTSLLHDLGLKQPPLTDWNKAIRLMAYDISDQQLRANQPLDVTLYFTKVGSIKRNLNVLVRLLDSKGREWARSEGWPSESPTSEWDRYDIWVDRHQLSLPHDAPLDDYRIDLTFYDSTTWEHLPATDAISGAPLGDRLVVTDLPVDDSIVKLNNTHAPLTLEAGETTSHFEHPVSIMWIILMEIRRLLLFLQGIH